MRNLTLLSLDSESCTRVQQDGGRCELENVKTVPFIGALVRRGDKKREAKEQPIEKYIEALEKQGCQLLVLTEGINSSLARRCFTNASRAGNSTSHTEFPFPVFIMTDDMPQVINQTKFQRPFWNLIFYTPRIVLKGFDSAQFQRLPLLERKLHTIDLITNLELLRRANLVVCTHSTNICRFLALLRDPRWPLNSMRSLDGEWTPMK